ncbi:MAG: hypothetical protein Q4E77_08235 [Conchiformibius sp.]|nr:hypothetical protein [Conchiformibius sp.]
MKRVTYNIHMDKKLKLEQLAIEASYQIGRTIKWTEIMEILINEFPRDAQQMIIHRAKASQD